jgi:hypothetical protein
VAVEGEERDVEDVESGAVTREKLGKVVGLLLQSSFDVSA